MSGEFKIIKVGWTIPALAPNRAVRMTATNNLSEGTGGELDASGVQH